MNIKGFFKCIASFILIVFISTIITSFSRPSVEAKADTKVSPNVKDSDIVNEWTTIYGKIFDEVNKDEFLPGEEGKNLNVEKDGVRLDVGDKVKFNLNVPKTGEYNLVLEYKVTDNKVLKNNVSIKWNDDVLVASLPSLWKDESKDYLADRYGNDIVPEQIKVQGFHKHYMKEFSSLNQSPYVFKFNEGENVFTLENNTQEIMLKSVYLTEVKKSVSYEEYLKSVKGNGEGKGLITIEAEDYIAKSHTSIRPANNKNIALYPYDPDSKKLNIIDAGSWADPGQKLMWQFDVETSGFYSLGLRFAQTGKDGMTVLRTIEIDGNNLFKELEQVSFPYTKFGYDNIILSDSEENPYKVWLEKGTHTISMEVNAELLQDIYTELRNIMAEITNTGTDIKKLTGGNVDANRTWSIEEYMPDIVPRLQGWSDRLVEIYNMLAEVCGQEPIFAYSLNVASDSLLEIMKKPEKIPNNLDKLSEGSGSAAQLVGDVATTIGKHPLSVDRLYIIGEGEELPSAKANFFTSAWESTKSFVKSFLPSSNGYSASSSSNEDELEVWVSRPIQYLELMQTMVDATFTPKTGIKVKLSLMPSEQKLVLANAAGTNPDVALGVTKGIPYQLALRGALHDYTKFPDFMSYISKEYNLETLVPFAYEDGIYGVAETMDFTVLAYRKDIMEKLNLPIPNTWDDINELMPELIRNAMNVSVPLAGTGMKSLAATSAMVFQHGGKVYSDDGLSVDLDSEENIKAFEAMTEMFTVYSVAQSTPSFYNNFRFGTMPLGVTTFGGYVQLMNAAPEIAGMWDIALSPGVKQADGTINRSQSAVERADIIFENSDKKEEAWEFLQWWLSKDTQIEYAYSLQNRFGPEFLWNSANLVAFAELPFPEEHKKVILEQWEHIKEVPSHPAAYMVEREMSNTWTDIVLNGESLRVAVDKSVMTINREITRKLEEFGYIKNGQAIKKYTVADVNDFKKK